MELSQNVPIFNIEEQVSDDCVPLVQEQGLHQLSSVTVSWSEPVSIIKITWVNYFLFQRKIYLDVSLSRFGDSWRRGLTPEAADFLKYFQDHDDENQKEEDSTH